MCSLHFFASLIAMRLVTCKQHPYVNVSIEPTSSNISQYAISSSFQGISVEYTTHQIYGSYGLFNQMIFGESFEELKGYISICKQNTIQSKYSTNIHIGCNAHNQVFVSNISQYNGKNTSFLWQLFNPGINANHSTISFMSRLAGSATRRFMLLNKNKNNNQYNLKIQRLIWPNEAYYDFNNKASFIMIKNDDNVSVSFMTNNLTHIPAQFISLNTNNNGIILSNKNTMKSKWIINKTFNYPLTENSYYGCGNGRTTDINYVDNISKMWMAYYLGNKTYILQQHSAFTLVTNQSDSFNGNNYQTINFSSILSNQYGIKEIGISNHGLNCQLGHYFTPNTTYSGYLYLKNVYKNMNIQVKISIGSTSGLIYDSQIVNVSSIEWKQYHFSLLITQKSNSSYCDITEPNGYYYCDGQFIISLINEGDVIDVDMVFLSKNDIDNKSYRKEYLDLVKHEGIRTIRNGGSMCNNNHYRWKYFRGLSNTRQPYHGNWYYQYNLSHSRGFGMFELHEFCKDIDNDTNCVVTFNNNETVNDMIDFVEYCFGNNNTFYGLLRITTDKHPNIYDISWIEIGNEQKLTDLYIEQLFNITTAMDNKLKDMILNKQIY
eukprot:376669_1